VSGLPSQGWDAWWHWHRNEILLPEHRPPVDPQDRARSQLSSLLIAQSQSTDATVRAAAVRALGRVAGDAAVPHLLARLRDPRLEVREDAILALGTTGRASAVHALLHIARYGSMPGKGRNRQPISSQSRTLAVIALGLSRRYGSRLNLDRVVRDLPVQIENLKTNPAQHQHRDLALARLLYTTLVESGEMQRLSRQLADAKQVSLDLRCRALESLGRARDNASLAVLIRGVRGTKLDARRSAALALGSFRHPEAMPAMVIAHSQEHEHLTRGFLLVSIGRQGGDEARGFLLRSIRTGPKTLRPWAALGLGLFARQHTGDDADLPDADVVDALRRAYRDEKSRHARGAHLIALGMARDTGSVHEFDKNLNDARTAITRIAAAEALALLGRDFARTRILTSLAIKPDHATRAALAEVLGYIGQPRDSRVLVSLLAQATPTEMSRLGRGLGVLASPESHAPLRGIIADRNRRAIVRATAIEALALMFSEHRGLNLAELAQNANFLMFSGWLARIADLNL